MKTANRFDYCIPLKSGDYFFDFNEYELYNGGKFGDLFCAKAASGWRPMATTGTAYDYTVKPAGCV